MSLGATYGYRLFPHLQIEAGLTTALHPTPELRGATFDIQPTDRFVWVPFGFLGILPLRNRRIEISLGGGGTYEHYSTGNIPAFIGLQSQAAWGGYLSVGAAVALERSRHFWLGASVREFLGTATRTGDHDRWTVVTGDLSFHF